MLCILSFSFAQAEEPKPNVFSIKGAETPDSVMKVMDFCTNVWNEYISTEIPIQISVSWQELKSNVNAYAKPTNYYSVNGIYYPVALAEKLQGKNLNGNDADIEVVINKSLKWFLDPNKIPESLAKGQYDLTTTLIHELAHGLGYIGNITSDNLETTEFPMPTIFDMFVADENGKSIVTKNGASFSLNNTLLTSNNLYWNGNFAKAYCGEPLKLYAPEKFNSGSTVYHLDETKYETNSGLELMTPILDQLEIFRTPDIATISMLADLGWTDYFINHSVPQNNSNFANATKISFNVNEQFLNKETQSILYSFDNGNHTIEIAAPFNEEKNCFEAEIPSFAFDHTISYKICSITSNNDKIYLPSENDWFSVFIGDDTESPLIEHTPITTTQNIDILISATITDNFDVDSAYVQYFVMRENKQVQDTLTANFEFSIFSTVASIQLSAINQLFKPGDKIYYNIVAVDKSGNTASTDFTAILLEEAMEPVHFFVTDFDDNSEDFFTLDKCTISKENGFSNKALHTAHPYAYTGVDGKYNQYTATLKSPIIIASNPATISFDEVVLVEPGKAGIEFGTFGFWDYVIVEGSKSLENDTWYALGKIGWDSQLQTIWKNRYYSSTKNDGDNENSLAVGDSTLFKNHKINLLENKYFRAGDTIFVRFRLQSDATNYAWGWTIDNLKIQERMALSIPFAMKQTVAIYPNPCTNVLYINREDLQLCKIYDNSGRLVITSNESAINVSNIQTGIYSILLQFDDGTTESQQFIKH